MGSEARLLGRVRYSSLWGGSPLAGLTGLVHDICLDADEADEACDVGRSKASEEDESLGIRVWSTELRGIEDARAGESCCAISCSSGAPQNGQQTN